MKLTFRQILSRPDRDGRCRIILDVAAEGQRHKLPTGVSCRPEHFHPDARRVVNAKDPDSARLNAKLAAVLAKVEKAGLQAAADEVPLTAAQLPAGATRKARAAAAPPRPLTVAEFYARWQADNPGQAFHSARRYKQVVAHLEAYHKDWDVTQLTRTDFAAYLQHLLALRLADATVSKHVKFLRECFKLAERVPPAWLKVKTKYGRSPALQAAELRQLLALDLAEDSALAAERDLFVFQTQLLLRDSDLRAVRPYHVEPVALPGLGRVPVLAFRQAKTGDEVRLPVPPEAMAVWERHAGTLPLAVQQVRNRRMKQLMERAGLTRPFVRVRYVQGTPHETVLPLWLVVTTHTARHTGADMVMLGSGGDSDLKEMALGHAAVYGHDSLERYGPALLRAWAAVLEINEKNAPGANPKIAPGFSAIRHEAAPSQPSEGVIFRRVSWAGSS